MTTKCAPIEVLNWDELVRYVSLFFSPNLCYVICRSTDAILIFEWK